MTRRSRAPRWAVEATGWASVLVLVSGITTVVSGVADPSARVVRRVPQTVAAVQDSDPVVAPAVTPVPKPQVVAKAPVAAVPAAPQTHYAVPHAGQAPLTALDVLGPPPGPVNDAVPAHTAAPAQRFAFLAGVTNYPAPTHHTIAGAQDALFVRQALLRNGWLPQNIHILTDREVTGAAMRQQLAWLRSKSTATSFTLFHYSGHVKQEGGHEKLWPADRDFVTDTQLTDLLGGAPGKMWVDIAGCESGGFLPGLPSANTLFTGSSEQSQKSYEYPQWGESVWTGLTWDLGLSQGKADANANGVTTVGEAIRYATYYAQAITFNQRPHGRQTPQSAGDPVRGWTLADPPSVS